MSARPTLLALVLSAAVALSACGSDDSSSSSTTASGNGPKVVATTTIAGDLVRNVAGDRAQVTTILPVNADPHDYEPRPSDAQAVTGADLIVRSGGEVDDWLGDVVSSAGSDATQVDLIDSVKTREGGHAHEDEHGAEEDHGAGDEHADEEGVDPHWWQNPQNAIAAVEATRAALVKADPDGAATYDANARAYTEQLRAMDTAIAACMADIPASQRKLVTNHDAFGYFADRYDIDLVGTVIPSLSTQSQASAGEVTDLVKTIQAEGVKTIYAENTVNPKLEQAIASRAGAKVGPQLWSDSLGPKDSTGATYLDMLRFNAGTLADGFTGRKGVCTLPSA